MNPTVAEIILDTLHLAGARHCYGIVGDTLNPFTDAIRRSPIEWVHMRHEEAGAMAAGAEALLGQRLTLCAGTCGPGSLHFVNGLFEAHRNRAPVLLIATQVPTPQMGMDFPQEVDLKPIFDTCSVHCACVHHPGQARRAAALAAQAAINLRGVAVLIVPGDILAQRHPEGLPYQAHHPQPVLRPADEELEHIARLLESGRQVTVFCGSGCEGAEAEVRALAERLQAPVAHTSRAKDFIEPDNPFNVGMTGMLGIESGRHAVQHCDTLLLLGADFAYTQFYPDKVRIIQIDRDATHLGRRHPVTLGVVGDIQASLQALLPRLKPKDEHKAYFLHDHQAMHRAALATLSRHERVGHGGLIHPPYLAHLIDQHARQDTIFTADGGSAMVWLLRHVRALPGRRTLSSLVHGTMANALPSALGAKKAFPERQVVAFCGDGGLSMLLGELLTVVQEEIDVKIVVFNNQSLGFVEIEQKVEGLQPAFTDLRNPDFAALARVVGLGGWHVSNADDLPAAIEAWLSHPGPALLDVMVNRDELVMPPEITAGEIVHTALYAGKALLTGHGDDVLALVSHNIARS